MTTTTNRKTQTALFLFLLTAALLLPQAARAGGFNINLGWHGKHSFLGLSIGNTTHYHARRLVFNRHHYYRPHRTWVPGHYETRVTYVTIPGCRQRRWIPARVEQIYLRDTVITRIVSRGHWEETWVPARREARQTKVFVSGHYR